MRRLSVPLAACLVCGLTLVVGDSTGVARASSGPFEPGSDWPVEAPEDHGMDPYTLGWSRVYAFQEPRNTQGVVVVRNGAIVAEWYAPEQDADSWAASWSVAKSFIERADRDRDRGGADPVGRRADDDVLPGVGRHRRARRSRCATCCTMARACTGTRNTIPPPGRQTDSEIIQLVAAQPDQLAYVGGAAGERARHGLQLLERRHLLLSGVIERATGMSVAEYAEQQLFGPIGIDQVEWWQDAAGHTLTYCCLDMPSRDFARIGLLYLNEGRVGRRAGGAVARG